MNEKMIVFEDIGTVIFRKNKRSKNIRIIMRPTKGILVTMPYLMSYKSAIQWAESKIPWIKKHLPKIKEAENRTIVFNENSLFKTRHRKLVIEKAPVNNLLARITNDTILISYPAELTSEKKEIQSFITKTIIETLRLEAKEYLPSRTLFLANKYNFNYHKIFIKNNKTVWGSCSSVNNINLNIHLMRLPDYLIDYVIIHELCHTVEKNHGIRFWNLMNSILGDAKRLSREIRKYSIQFY